MKKLILIATLLTASLSWAADAKKKATAPVAAPQAASAAKADVTGGLKWTGYGVGKSHTGDLNLKSGSVEFKGEQLVGGTFVIDMTTLKTGDSPKLQGHLQSPDFFDIQKFPEGTFKITKVEIIPNAKAGGPSHKITGDLTIKGKTHTETLDATIAKEGTKWTAKAETEIKDRTQYDIVYNSAKFKTASALGDKLIEDKIKIELNLATQ
jgi:polyisoprenoid-binding protein YceI